MFAVKGRTLFAFALVLASITILLSVVLVVCIDLGLQPKCLEVVIEHILLLSLDLSKQLSLVYDSLLSLLVCTLDSTVHPVFVITCGLQIDIFQLLSDVLPDFSVLEIGIQLDQLHVLFFTLLQFVEVKTNSEECCEHTRSYVVGFDESI